MEKSGCLEEGTGLPDFLADKRTFNRMKKNAVGSRLNLGYQVFGLNYYTMSGCTKMTLSGNTEEKKGRKGGPANLFERAPDA